MTQPLDINKLAREFVYRMRYNAGAWESHEKYILAALYKLAAEKDAEIERVSQQVDAQCGFMANIADTLRVRGIPNGKPLDERVIALAQELDRHKAALKVATDALKPYARMGYPRAKTALTQIEKELKP